MDKMVLQQEPVKYLLSDYSPRTIQALGLWEEVLEDWHAQMGRHYQRAQECFDLWLGGRCG